LTGLGVFGAPSKAAITQVLVKRELFEFGDDEDRVNEVAIPALPIGTSFHGRSLEEPGSSTASDNKKKTGKSFLDRFQAQVIEILEDDDDQEDREMTRKEVTSR
jgi:hypothetical protein